MVYVWSPEIAAGEARDCLLALEQLDVAGDPGLLPARLPGGAAPFCRRPRNSWTRASCFLGRISFSLYLLHYPLLQVLTIKLAQWGYSPRP